MFPKPKNPNLLTWTEKETIRSAEILFPQTELPLHFKVNKYVDCQLNVSQCCTVKQHGPYVDPTFQGKTALDPELGTDVDPTDWNVTANLLIFFSSERSCQRTSINNIYIQVMYVLIT
jgi:hypothetical protein